MQITEIGKNDKNQIKKLKEHCHSVCKKEIDLNWIQRCLCTFDYCYVAVDTKREIKGILTFIIDGHLEVTLLCSNNKEHGLGRELINCAINFAKNAGIECKLNSVPKSRGFYLRC